MTPFDPLSQMYVSQRFPVYACGGMVNASSPQAAAAGLELLRQGGNAVDAAVAAASTLTVTEPTSNGIGSDAFAIIWSEKEQKLLGLNASGPAPMLADPDRIRGDGRDGNGKMPVYGWTPVTVPGAPKAWAELTSRLGRMPLEKNLLPAIRYAREGYPCAPNLAWAWKTAHQRYRTLWSDSMFGAWFQTFAPGGKTPETGELVRLPWHGDALEEIASTHAESFYTGRLARKMDERSRKDGGYLRYEDLAAFRPRWVEPVRVRYRDYEVCEIPPNGQGIVALIALSILQFFPMSQRSPLTCHRQIEALKMAFADAFLHVTDPEHMEVDIPTLLSPDRCEKRAMEMNETARCWSSTLPRKSGTVYLCCADAEGNLVSYIQSNYMGFGSGIVVDGIALQNRGADFSLNPGDINCLRPGKRTYHTIIPGFLMKDGKPVGPFGVMGGYMQPQGHVQLMNNFIDFHMNPQQALDAPRFQWMRDGSVTVESRFEPAWAGELERRGHRIRTDLNTPSFGRGQMIVRLDNGVLVGGCESRTDSLIACM